MVSTAIALLEICFAGLVPYGAGYEIRHYAGYHENLRISPRRLPWTAGTALLSSSSCCDESEPQQSNEGEGSSQMSSSISPSASSTSTIQPEILQPFLEAASPRYMCEGVVGLGAFVVSREGGPTLEELSNANILKIVRSECSDLEVNTLCWKCLGYRFVDGDWTSAECFPKWKERFPCPPDLLGMQRIYEREVDQTSLRSNQALVRSVPVEFKQSLKTHLKPLGFNGFQYAELTPNKTRRAQCANWLLYYREQLFGVTLEELKARKEQKARADASASTPEEWSPPVTEVF
jgi:Domain of unknown function (DUF1823)